MNVYEEKSEDARVVGTMKKDGLCFILKEEGADSEWIYIESGVVRGFVKKADLMTDEKSREICQ